MTRSFHIIDKALDSERIFQSPKVKYVPKQCFSETIEHAFAFIKQFLFDKHNDVNEWIVCVDGREKRLLSTASSVDDNLTKWLSDQGISHQVLNLSKILNLNVEDIHASTQLLPALQAELKDRQKSAVIVVGSGSLTDLVKHALHVEQLPHVFISVPTALTVTAFTSAFAVIDEGGAKRTQKSRTLDATVWIADILTAAPIEMCRAGYGDLLARFVAYGDWYVAHCFGLDDGYDELAFRLMEPFAEPLKTIAADIGQPTLNSDCIAVLSEALSMAGIAMSVAEQTTPLSGFEHTISHAIDFLKLTSHRNHIFHGEQVALATYTSAVVYDCIKELPTPDAKQFVFLTDEQVKKLISRLIDAAPFWGIESGAPSKTDLEKNAAFQQQKKNAVELFAKDYLKKQEKWNLQKEHLTQHLEQWPTIQNQLKRLCMDAKSIEKLLQAAKLPVVPEETHPPLSNLEYRWAVRFAPFVRSRFCIADLIFWMNEDPVLFATL